MLWPRNGLGFPMISLMIEREVRRRFSPSTVDEPGVRGLEFGVFEFVWDLGFGIWDLNVLDFHGMTVYSDFGFSLQRRSRRGSLFR
jgi:hypothetical protein